MAAVMTKVPKSPAVKKPATLGAMIDAMWATREAKRLLDEQIKLLEADIKERELAILTKLEAEGVTASRGSKASASVTATLCANLVDYDLFTAYVKKTGYFHLFQRRVSDTAARELFETKGQVPGLESYQKIRLNLRSL